MEQDRALKQFEVVDDAMAEVYRNKSAAERLELVFAANRTHRLRLEGFLRTYHPDWNETEIRREVARRMLGGTT
jgi:hypothetical protein